MNWSPLGSSVHEISQARILEWAAILFSRVIILMSSYIQLTKGWQHAENLGLKKYTIIMSKLLFKPGVYFL